MKTFDIVDALVSLTPGAKWSLTGDQYDGLTWFSENIEQAAVLAKESAISKLKALGLTEDEIKALTGGV